MGDAFFLSGGVLEARSYEAPRRMAAPLARGSPCLLGGRVRAGNPGGVRTKGREKLRDASLPPSALPAPSPPRPLLLIQTRPARVVSAQSRPPPREEMAEEPEPQVKGARPPPAPPGAPARSCGGSRAAPEAPGSLSCPPQDDSSSPPQLSIRSSRAPPPQPAPAFPPAGRCGRFRTASALGRHTHAARFRRVWGAVSPESPPGAGVRGLRGWAVGGCSEKLGRPSGRVSQFAHSALGARAERVRRRGVPSDARGGVGASWKRPKQCVRTGIPRKQWPGRSTRAGRRARLRDRGRGWASPRTPTRAPALDARPGDSLGCPKICPRESRGACSSLSRDARAAFPGYVR